MLGGGRQLVAAALVASLGCAACSEADPRPTRTTPARTPSPTSVVRGPTADPSGGFPPARLVERQQEWDARHHRHIGGTDDAMASANGAWRALLEWCAESQAECTDESANYITGVLGPEPRAVFEGCRWRERAEVIVDMYAFTWSLLGRTKRATATQLLDRYPALGCDDP